MISDMPVTTILCSLFALLFLKTESLSNNEAFSCTWGGGGDGYDIHKNEKGVSKRV